MESKHLLLLSGGLDSVILAHKLQKDGVAFDSVFFDANKTSTLKELEHARHASVTAGNRFEVVDISAMMKSFVGHVTSNYVMMDELDRAGDTPILLRSGTEGSVVPSGFPILLSIASFLAQISGREVLHVGITREQADAVPTTRQFFKEWGKTLSLLNGKGVPIAVETPFIEMTKADVVKLGKRLGVDASASWSCVYDSVAHCGRCPRCLERIAAFRKAKVKDPTKYLS